VRRGLKESMSKRSLYPRERSDRLFFFYFVAVTLVASIMTIGAYLLGGGPSWQRSVLLLLVGPVGLAVTYFLQSPTGQVDPYSRIISNITRMGGELNKLSEFLKQEQTKVAQSEAIVKRLQVERNDLKAIVAADRETVNAVLAAQARNNGSWKERVIGFVSGVAASILAAWLYEYFH
jgi:hypothetical protein